LQKEEQIDGGAHGVRAPMEVTQAVEPLDGQSFVTCECKSEVARTSQLRGPRLFVRPQRNAADFKQQKSALQLLFLISTATQVPGATGDLNRTAR
jgi:hypothetical protein